MANNFEFFFQKVLKDEGVTYEDVPGDNGGPTCCGITIADVARWNGVKLSYDKNGKLIRSGKAYEDMRQATMKINPTSASAIYKKFYWDVVRADELPSGIDYAVVDYAVNSGTGRAIPKLGHFVGVVVNPKKPVVTDAMIEAVRNYGNQIELIQHLQDERRDFLIAISNKPGQMKFKKGWLAREARVRELSVTLAQKADDTNVIVKAPKPMDAVAIADMADVAKSVGKVAVAAKSRTVWGLVGSAVLSVVSHIQAAVQTVADGVTTTVEALPTVVGETKENVQAFTDLGHTIGATEVIASSLTVLSVVLLLYSLLRHVDFKHGVTQTQTEEAVS